MAERKPKTSKQVENQDLTLPIVKSSYKVSEDSCFGRMYDAATNACSMCADNEACAILNLDANRAKAEQVAKGKKFLDVATHEPTKVSVSDNVIEYMKQHLGVTYENFIKAVKEISGLTEDEELLKLIKSIKAAYPKLKFRNKEVTWCGE
jgi:hypothetical protein